MFFHFEQRDEDYTTFSGSSLEPLPHLHKHLEIVMLWEGRVLAAADSKEVMMEAGDLYLAFPNQIHYYHDQPGHQWHSLAIVSPDLLPEFRREFTELLPVSPVLPAAAENPRIVAAIENLTGDLKCRPPYTDAWFRGNMLVLMCELLGAMPLEKKPASDANLCAGIIKYCYENYIEDISLETLARELHVSRFYISHLFGQQLHVSFRDYINSLRIGHAVELMKNGRLTVTEIACAVGYNSTRTFGRCFRQITGQSPREFLKNRERVESELSVQEHFLPLRRK